MPSSLYKYHVKKVVILKVVTESSLILSRIDYALIACLEPPLNQSQMTRVQ